MPSLKVLVALHPIGRLGEAQEVGNLALWLSIFCYRLLFIMNLDKNTNNQTLSLLRPNNNYRGSNRNSS